MARKSKDAEPDEDEEAAESADASDKKDKKGKSGKEDKKGKKAEQDEPDEEVTKRTQYIGLGLIASVIVGFSPLRDALQGNGSFENAMFRFLACFVVCVFAASVLGRMVDAAPEPEPEEVDEDELVGGEAPEAGFAEDDANGDDLGGAGPDGSGLGSESVAESGLGADLGQDGVGAASASAGSATATAGAEAAGGGSAG